jgi:branched-chain amino acid transport system substrate-binding protein
MSTMAGCLPGDGSSNEPEGPINIAHLAPMSSPLGVGSRRTAEMAVEELNADGGIMDEDVELTHVDTESDPTTAQEEVQALLAEDEADMMVGTFVSEVTQAILNATSDDNVPLIVTGSAAPSTITDFIGEDYDQYKNLFRTGPINSDFQAEAFLTYVDHLNDLHGWEDFALLTDDAAWTLPFRNALPDGLDEGGYNLVMNESLNVNTEDFSPIINNVLEQDADAVIRFFAHIDGSAFLVERAQRQLEFGVEGIHVTGMFPSYLQATEGAAMYESTSQSGGGGTSDFTEFTQPFVEEYQQRAEGGDPPIGHPMYMGFNTYDAIPFYAKAVEEADTWDYVNDLDSIVDGMLSTTHTGVVGELDLFGTDAEYPHDAIPARTDDGVISNFPITQWQPAQEGVGTLECVYPEQDATAEHMPTVW